MRMKKLFATSIGKLCLLSFLFLLPYKQLLAQTYFYYVGTGALNTTTNWGINTNGTGTAPADFTTANQIFIIQNATNIVFNSGTWAVSGTGSKAVLGNPTYATPGTPSSAITLTIASGSSIVASPQLFEISIPSSGNHKIVYQNASAISFGTVNDSNLELVFDGNTLTTTTSRTFGNVSLINNANIDMSGASIVLRNLTVGAGSTLLGPIGASANYIAVRSGGSVVINGTFRAGRTGTVTSPGVGGLFTTGVTIPVTASTTFATLLFQDVALTPAITLGSNSTIDYYRGTTGQTGTQGITPMAYANLILSNSTDASNKSFAVPGNVTVSGTLTINLIGAATITAPSSTTNLTLLPNARLVINSATTLATNDKLTLQSNASGTALIGTLATGASITGNVIVQQFIPSGSRRYRFLSHPFTTAQALTQLTDNIDITGGTSTGFTVTSTNNPSAFSFTTANANGNATNDGGWAPFTDATATNWARWQGIRVLVRGTKAQSGTLDGTNASPAAVTLDMSGVINTGNQSIPLVTGGTGSTAGFNFVGNPYPSPVNIGAVLTAATNLGSAFYLRNPQTGAFITLPIAGNPSYIIPANTAFFVQATAATSLNFTEANKAVCATCPTLFRTTTPQNFVQIKAIKNEEEYDNIDLYLSKIYSSSYDVKTDAIKLMNDGLSIYVVSTDKQKLALDYRNLNDAIIPLGIALPKSLGIETYTLKVTQQTLPTTTKLYLHDKLNNTYTLIEKDTNYSLTIDPTNLNSIGENRLALVFAKSVSK